MSVHYKGEETLIFYEIINDFYSVGVRFERLGKRLKGSYDQTILFCRNSTWNGKVLSPTFILTNYLYVYV